MGSILITGASGGIGRACAERFLGAGWTVGLMARRADKLEEIAAVHENAVVLPCDVGDAAAVETAFEQFADKAGRLDVLFNNAGIFTPAAPIDEISLDDWHRARSVNLDGMFYCARAAFAQMRRQSPHGGRIINNGSISAHAPRPDSIPYTATKHAVTGLTKTASLDGRKYDIAVSQIDIGNAVSPMTERMAQGHGVKQSDGTLKVEPRMPSEHVGEAVVMMANMPMETTVQFLTIQATKMPWIGRG